MDTDPASVQLVLQGETLRRDQTVSAKGVTISSILELRAKSGVKRGSDDDGEEEEVEELDENQVRSFRDSLRGLYVVARIFFLLLLNCSAFALPRSCLAKHTCLLVHLLAILKAKPEKVPSD